MFYQEAGIGRGDHFSPQLFSFCVAIIIYPLRHWRVKMGMYLYVDDFLIMFGRETTKQQLQQVFHELRRFSAVSGLQQNVGKSSYVTKGTLHPEALHFVQDSLTARAYVADRSVVSALNTVYNILFSFDSWGLTTHQLLRHRDQGGYSVPMPKTWLAAQGGAAAMAALTCPTIMPICVM